MKFLINNSNPTKQHSDCLVVGVFEDQILTPAAQAIDNLSGGSISKLVKSGDVSGKVAQTLFLYDLILF